MAGARVDRRKLAARAAGNPADLRVTVVSGKGSATALPVPGIKRGDALLAVIDLNSPTAAQTWAARDDFSDESTITADGEITIGGTISTAAETVLVFWYDFTPPYATSALL